MYKPPKMAKSTIRVNKGYKGECIERKLERIIHNKEPISDPATQLIYTDRAEGVIPDMDIRTDRWEYAIEATEQITKSHLAKRQERLDALKQKNNPGGDSIQGTETGTK